MIKSDLFESIKALKNGDTIVYPTDTLYALGADVYNDNAVKKIFKLKKRPFSNPLPIAVADIKEIEKIAYIDHKSKRLAEYFLPGSLTLVLNKKNSSLNMVTANLDKIAIRIPDNKIAIDLLSEFGPLTVTSANIHGKKTPHVINEIKMQFNKEVAIYLDYGILRGKPSTIIDLTSGKPVILRRGSIAEKEILDAISHG
jgi:L-threonylcarbamoyladenylate synthase